VLLSVFITSSLIVFNCALSFSKYPQKPTVRRKRRNFTRLWCSRNTTVLFRSFRSHHVLPEPWKL